MADPVDPDAEWANEAVWALGEAVASIPGVRRDRDRFVLRQRCGLDGTSPTLQELGDELGISRERVRQIQERGLRHLAGRTSAAQRRSHLLDSFGVETAAAVSPDAVGRYVSERLAGLNDSVTAKAIAYSLRPPKDRARLVGATMRWLKAEDVRRQEERRVEAAARRVDPLERLLAATWWPIASSPTIDTARQRRWREHTGRKGSAGELESAKLQRLVAYESDLERAFFERLEFSAAVVFYQEQPVAIRWNEDGLGRRYFPDVLVVQSDGRALLVEVKQQWMMALRPTVDRLAAAVDLCSEKGLGLLVTDGRRTIDDLACRTPPPGFIDELDRLVIAKGVVDARAFMPLARRLGAYLADTAAAVLQLRLSWRMSPFELSRHPGAGPFFDAVQTRSLHTKEPR